MAEARPKTLMPADAVGGIWDSALELAGVRRGAASDGPGRVRRNTHPPAGRESKARLQEDLMDIAFYCSSLVIAYGNGVAAPSPRAPSSATPPLGRPA